MAINTLAQALYWAYELRNTYMAMGHAEATLDMVISPQCRENGVVEDIPLIAVEHRRLFAIWATECIRKDVQEQLDLIKRMDTAGRALLAAGWTPIQLTANALNKTVENAKEYVAAGFVLESYGMPG